jgi:hypothetical protein
VQCSAGTAGLLAVNTRHYMSAPDVPSPHSNISTTGFVVRIMFATKYGAWHQQEELQQQGTGSSPPLPGNPFKYCNQFKYGNNLLSF